MKFYFSAPTSMGNLENLAACKVRCFLLSFLTDAKLAPRFKGMDVIIDSGAFSAWNSGKTLDMAKYLAFVKRCPKEWVFVNVDVIPETGSSIERRIECGDKSFVNFLHLREQYPEVKWLPVYHYGEPIEFLQRYLEITDYIGLSPANDIHEKEKRRFLDKCFGALTPQVKTHGFGYTSETGLEQYPFYSVDSISYKRLSLGGRSEIGSFRISKTFQFLAIKRIKEVQKLERHLTQVWKHRGIDWPSGQSSEEPYNTELLLGSGEVFHQKTAETDSRPFVAHPVSRPFTPTSAPEVKPAPVVAEPQYLKGVTVTFISKQLD